MDLTPPVARYEQVARHLKAQILSGAYQAGDTLPGAPALAGMLGTSQSVVQKAYEMLDAAGLVRSEVGRGTVVVARRRYQVRVEVPRRGAPRDAAAEPGALRAALEDAARNEAAITEIGFAGAGPYGASVLMTVEAADPRRAVDAGYPVVLAAGVQAGWSWDGWGLDAASVSARPGQDP